MDVGVRVEHDTEAAVLRLVLDRPERLNAVDAGMLTALHAALEAAAADRACRAVILTGAGRGFCAGQHLGETLTETEKAPDLGAMIERVYNPLIRRMRSLPIPIVCAVNGIAAGAGASLALACDIVLAARSARFVQAFVRIGLIPDAGGSFFLPRLVGEARARAAMLLGEPVEAEQAAAWGMIWRAVADDDLAGEATALASVLARQPAGAMALIKQALAASPGHDLDRQLDLERDLQREAGRQADFREGIQAFREKRPARFAPLR